nr:hypothetical protein [Mucilaginibacter sp. L294]
MKKYILTAEKLHGALTFGYDINSLLVFFHNEAEMAEHQKKWLLQHCPFTEAQLQQLKEKINGQLEEVATEITFDIFWEKYGKKINRKRCLAIWAKMTERQRMQAVHGIWVYDRYLTRTGYRAKADPSTYLSDEYYLNDWDKLK